MSSNIEDNGRKSEMEVVANKDYIIFLTFTLQILK